MEENVEERQPVRVFGTFHTGVGAREATLLGGVVRNAWRKDFTGDGVSEGMLANYVRKNLDDKAWKTCLQNLIDWGLVELVAGYRRDVRRIMLTPLGKHWALQLCGERQLEGKTVDGIEE